MKTDESCKKTNSCPATILLTGNNKTLGLDLGGCFFPRSSLFKSPGVVNALPSGVFASNAYLEFLCGPGVKILFDFVKEMPQHPTISGGFDISYIVSTLFCTWVILQLYPNSLKPMTTICNSCCVYLNLQIAFTFLAAGIFSKVKTASVIAYAVVFGTGLLGSFYFGKKVDDPTFSKGWIAVMKLYPGLALYHMLYEFSKYALQGSDTNAGGMKWKDLNDSTNGMKELLIIMVVEWFVLLFVAYYVDQVISSRSGVRKSPLFLLRKFQGQPSSSEKTSLISDESRDFDQAEKADVAREREKVEQLLTEPDPNYAVVCDDLKKVYPAVDGNPPKLAVRGLSLALTRGECFGMLGPNGVGKTSFIKMMIGLTEPSSGTAYVQGLDMSTDMDRIYTSMGQGSTYFSMEGLRFCVKPSSRRISLGGQST
ncbi:ABC transporter A family member 8 [Camellia lanceoleosa]|uniref:ABC transporter A family member 8 n=1 Tax=Camellia lanceoleosa TaxID=1840588 RepID=A0ACC0FCR9_9ERIC|nr:ABC transporter A family member 8 [Camellia lanceoleosa]